MSKSVTVVTIKQKGERDMKESYVERWEREQKEKAAQVAEEKVEVTEEKVEVTEEVTENEQNAGREGQETKKVKRRRK